MSGIIQLVGTQRSGSNLLRLMLNEHPQIAAPHPPHILQVFRPLIQSYGDLSDQQNLRALAEDVLQLIKNNPVPWKFIPNAEDMINDLKQPDLDHLFERIYLLYAEKFGKTWVVCKSMSNVFQFQNPSFAALKPKVIYLHRDGRDVCSSFQRTVVGPKHPFLLAKKWHQEQEECLHLKKILPATDFFQLSYEDLIHHPKKQLSNICEWLKVPFQAQMLDYYQSDASKLTARSGAMWKNLTQPILKDNSGKYRQELSAEELSIIEGVAMESLIRLGYPCEGKKQVHSQNEIVSFEKEDAFLQKQIKKRLHREHELRSKYENYINWLNEKKQENSLV